MISKELFIKFLNNWINFEDRINAINETILGNKYSLLCESDWFESAGIMLDTFLESHFTECGCELINAYLFDSIDKRGLILYEETLFEPYKETFINTLDELWAYLVSDRKTYIKE